MDDDFLMLLAFKYFSPSGCRSAKKLLDYGDPKAVSSHLLRAINDALADGYIDSDEAYRDYKTLGLSHSEARAILEKSARIH